jgi:hypothetical protein
LADLDARTACGQRLSGAEDEDQPANERGIERSQHGFERVSIRHTTTRWFMSGNRVQGR